MALTMMDEPLMLQQLPHMLCYQLVWIRLTLEKTIVTQRHATYGNTTTGKIRKIRNKEYCSHKLFQEGSNNANR